MFKDNEKDLPLPTDTSEKTKNNYYFRVLYNFFSCCSNSYFPANRNYFPDNI